MKKKPIYWVEKQLELNYDPVVMRLTLLFSLLFFQLVSGHGQTIDTIAQSFLDTTYANRERLIREEVVFVRQPFKERVSIIDNIDVKVPCLKKYQGIIEGRGTGEDTIVLKLKTKEGKLFKWVRLLSDSLITSEVPLDEFNYSGRFPAEGQSLELQAKGKFSFKKTLASLNVERQFLQRSDTIIYTNDTLIIPSLDTIWKIQNGLKQVDTIMVLWRDTLLQEKQGPLDAQLLLSETRIAQDRQGQANRTHKEIVTEIQQKKPISISPDGYQLAPQWKWKSLKYERIKGGDTLFATKDTLVFSITAIDDVPIRKLYLSDDQQKVHGVALKATSFKDTIVVEDEAFFELKMKGKLGFFNKRRTKLEVTRFPRSIAQSFYQISDTLYQDIRKDLYDTVMLQIATAETILAARLNYEGQSNQQIPVFVPTQPQGVGNLLFLTYWIGVGEKTLADYVQLESEIPADWAQPGVSAALAAYGLSHPVFLPSLKQKDVFFAFTNTSDMKRMLKGNTPRNPIFIDDNYRGNKGRITRQELQTAKIQARDPITNNKGYGYHFCLQNKSEINTYPIQLKIVAYYQQYKDTEVTRKLVGIHHHREELKP